MRSHNEPSRTDPSLTRNPDYLRPAHRDHKTYSEVVCHEVHVSGHTTPDLQSWLRVAYFCGQKDKLDFKVANQKLKNHGLRNVIASKVDDLTIMVSGMSNGVHYPLSTEEIETMKSYFEYVVPWFKEYIPQVIRRFELIGIPLHF